MQIRDRIDAIEKRAAEMNLKLGHICREAGVYASTLLRWKTGACDPKVSNVEQTLKALEDVLERRELAMLSRLKERFTGDRLAS